jgi:ParB/RepB/Spo0J family partition protein
LRRVGPNPGRSTVINITTAHSGSVVHDNIKPEYIHDLNPNRIRIWKYADRDEGDLNRRSCANLWGSLELGDELTGGRKQLIPVMVRKIEGEKDFDYELIYGRRRWWVCKERHRKVAAIITKDDDAACLVHMHTENEHRKDITPMDKARSYITQYRYRDEKNKGFYASATIMADKLSVPQSTLQRFLVAGELWFVDEVVAVTGSLTDVARDVAGRFVRALAEDRQGVLALFSQIHTEGGFDGLNATRMLMKTARAYERAKSKEPPKKRGNVVTVSGLGEVKFRRRKDKVVVEYPKEFFDFDDDGSGAEKSVRISVITKIALELTKKKV